MNYPGFWRQLGAVLVDQIIVLLPAWFVSQAYLYSAVAGGANLARTQTYADLAFFVLMGAFFVSYYVVANGKYGVTVGRRLMNLKLVRIDQPNRDGIGYGRAAWRLALFALLSGFVRLSAIPGVPLILAALIDSAAGATVLWMLIDDRRRTLEDLLAGTALVHDKGSKFPAFDPDKLAPSKIRPLSFGFMVIVNAVASVFTALQR